MSKMHRHTKLFLSLFGLALSENSSIASNVPRLVEPRTGTEHAVEELAEFLSSKREVSLQIQDEENMFVTLYSDWTDKAESALVMESLLVPSSLLSREMLESLEAGGRLLGKVAPLHPFLTRDVDQVDYLSAFEVAEHLLSPISSTLCGDVRAKSTVSLSLNGKTMSVRAKYYYQSYGDNTSMKASRRLDTDPHTPQHEACHDWELDDGIDGCAPAGIGESCTYLEVCKASETETTSVLFRGECKSRGNDCYCADGRRDIGVAFIPGTNCPAIEDFCPGDEPLPDFCCTDTECSDPTLKPTPHPTPPEAPTCPPGTWPQLDGSCGGEPHFHTIHGDFFDYHGVCDLVLMKSASFGSGLGLDLHVRTEAYEGSYSIISNAALRIGSDVLEVLNDGNYYVNGVLDAALPAELGAQYSVSKTSDAESKVFTPDVSHGFTKPELKESVLFKVDLGNGEYIEVQAWKMFLWVNVHGSKGNFEDGVGLMGTWKKEGKIARDGSRNIEDPNEFAEEWQVLGSEPKLFQTTRAPQHPEACLPAPTNSVGRRLGQEHTAEKACSHVEGPKKEFCIFDVMVTGDIEIANAYGRKTTQE